jgi:hypothetical protein
MKTLTDDEVKKLIPKVGDKSDIFGIEAEYVSVYTAFQAVEDGILFDTKELPLENIEDCPFRFITTNLLRTQKYMISSPDVNSEILNIQGIIDLINECSKQCYEQSKKENREDGNYFTCKIETPNDEEIIVWVHPNEIPNKWTILLPEDY